jgi:hypothetical protein
MKPFLRALSLCLVIPSLISPLTGQSVSKLELEKSSALNGWEKVTITPDMVSSTGELLVPTSGSQQFYRMKVRLLQANTAPTISDIAAQSIYVSRNTGALAFTIGDAQTAASSLTLSGSSSNTTLVPNANIVFGGSGANRTVTVTPANAQSGTATITVTVSDGSLAASDTFLLTVTVLPAGVFAASLNVYYAQQSIPYYRTTLTANYNYVITNGTATQYAGTITPATSTTLNATAASGTLTNVLNRALTLSGSITGTGTNGAGSTIVPISGTVSAVPVYFPAFYKITTTSTPPTWTTADVQTPTNPAGLTITYPNAQPTNYAWLATKFAVGSIYLVITGFGDFLIDPNVVSTVTISGEDFYLYGFTGLADGFPVKLRFNTI